MSIVEELPVLVMPGYSFRQGYDLRLAGLTEHAEKLDRMIEVGRKEPVVA